MGKKSTFKVTIRATVTKTIEVAAKNNKDAVEEAFALFSVLNEDGVPEDYDQEVLKVEREQI